MISCWGGVGGSCCGVQEGVVRVCCLGFWECRGRRSLKRKARPVWPFLSSIVEGRFSLYAFGSVCGRCLSLRGCFRSMLLVLSVAAVHCLWPLFIFEGLLSLHAFGVKSMSGLKLFNIIGLRL